MNHRSRNFLTLGATAIALAAMSVPSQAQERVNWKMQSAFSSQVPHAGSSGQRFAKDVERMSGGLFKITFYEPRALVPSLECFEAAVKGTVEACWTNAGFHAGKSPAIIFFTSTPFGPQIGEFLAWKWFGGGNRLRDEIYAQHGLIAFDSTCSGPETSGWFRKEITSLDDLKGLKMRFFGLGAKVMEKLGVSTELLAPADIFPALERGAIEATEFGMPTMDIKEGFYRVAKFNYFPGWHQPITCNELLMNRKAFDALPDSYKAMIEVAAGKQVLFTYAETEALNFDAMAEMQKKYGVQIRRWSDAAIAAFEKAWQEVIKEESVEDPMFKKVADHYLDFRRRYRAWAEAQVLKSTYLGK